MSNTRNRGKNSNDETLFGSVENQQKLREAVKDMHYLLSHGYAERSSLKLVGNKFRLNNRQQRALLGMSASQQQIERRKYHEIAFEQLTSEPIHIDGFNLLIVLESVLSDAYVFQGLDHSYRDLSGVHGTYKRVRQTEQVLKLVGDILKDHEVIWVFDKPVSNSGRLKTILRTFAETQGFNWNIHLDHNPDKTLAESQHIVVTSDAWILDRAQRWLNLAQYIIEQKLQYTEIISARS